MQHIQLVNKTSNFKTTCTKQNKNVNIPMFYWQHTSCYKLLCWLIQDSFKWHLYWQCTDWSTGPKTQTARKWCRVVRSDTGGQQRDRVVTNWPGGQLHCWTEHTRRFDWTEHVQRSVEQPQRRSLSFPCLKNTHRHIVNDLFYLNCHCTEWSVLSATFKTLIW